MNERERFRRVFANEPVDRPPRLEEGVRDEVLALWRTQGMPAGTSHCEVFGLTPHEIVGPDLRCRSDCYGKIMSGSARDYARALAATRDRFGDDWPELVGAPLVTMSRHCGMGF